MTPIAIGSRLELFVDDELVEGQRGDLTRRLHEPTPRDVVFPNVTDPVVDEAGHGLRAGHAYMTVLRDADRYRMYYGVVRGHGTDGAQRWLHYAESPDGIAWTTPDLGLFAVSGTGLGNAVWDADLSPFVDANPAADPGQPYKAMATMKRGPQRGLFPCASVDGVRWQLLRDQPVITEGKFDSQNLAFWDAAAGCYRAYWRDFLRHGEARGYRAIRTATSADFVTWSDPVWLYYPEREPEELYTNQILPYFRAPHILVGFPARYVQRADWPGADDLPEPERRRFVVATTGVERLGSAVTDTLFISSRDGVTFRVADGPFIRPGLRRQDNWIYGDNYVNWGLVETAVGVDGVPDELTFYVAEGSRRPHHSKVFRRHTLRLDGFVSVRAGQRGGELLTRPLTFAGSELVVNLSTAAAGHLRAELQDLHGLPLPGFALADAVEVVGDDLACRVRWRGAPDLAAHTGTPVRLRFCLREADLYAFRFR